MAVILSYWNLFCLAMMMAMTLVVLSLFINDQKIPNWLRLSLTVVTSYFIGSSFVAIWM